jgi:phage baseplate assembly protein W
MPNQQRKSFLGTGLAFPLRPNQRGEIALVSGEKDIEQSIEIILGTRPGERVMRPTFGCRAQELIFEPRDATTFTLMKTYVEEALKFWEPRINVNGIDISIDDANDGAVFVEIQYEIKETHDVRSIVYPFFLTGNESG